MDKKDILAAALASVVTLAFYALAAAGLYAMIGGLLWLSLR